ncbi:hypothetical protein [Agrobacterium larrymoorei]|uniref:hypothetical protein n=1 Tax=Agrobacterium larrymoorei TaxID=160699 RepID=UPI001F24DE50|nr:hypothetical protein [Agrobacterium larrymoorei]
MRLDLPVPSRPRAIEGWPVRLSIKPKRAALSHRESAPQTLDLSIKPLIDLLADDTCDDEPEDYGCDKNGATDKGDRECDQASGY